MPTLLDIQNESGPLWQEIQAEITAAFNRGKSESDALKAIITGLQDATAKAKTEADATLEKAINDAHAASHLALKEAQDKAEADLSAAKDDAAKAVKIVADKYTADTDELNAKIEKLLADIRELTSERDAATQGAERLKAVLAVLGNEQREKLKAAAIALGEATALNTRALADDDAEKLAQQKAVAQKALDDAKAAAQAAGLAV